MRCAHAGFGASARAQRGVNARLALPTTSTTKRVGAFARRVRGVVRVAAMAKKSKGGGRGGGASGEGATRPGDAPVPAPARITGKSNGLSVHAQIKLVERFKALTGDGAGQVNKANALNASKASNAREGVGNARGRDRAYEEELARRRREKAKASRDKSELKEHSGAGIAPLLLIDGYNVCGLEDKGIDEANAAFRAGDLDTARLTLTQEIENFKAFSGYRVVVVWDADRNRNKDEDEIEGDLDSGVQTVYSVKNDADSWIEARVVEEMREHASRLVYVATSDGALSSLVRGSGAYVVNAKAFVEELRRATQGEKEILQEMAIAARWNKGKKIAAVGVKDDDVKRKLMEMYKTAPSMEAPANAPKGAFKRQSQSEEVKAKINPTAPKWAEMRAQRRKNESN
mmetsp:Transcript_3124/g.10407  ORF Transcript_3124/g.10407 Transcript_3124/m.10407 type:complete len:401 (+) Transcript_3124:73-1275(+)